MIVVKDSGSHHSPSYTIKRKLRICLDPRGLNEALEREPYHTCSVNEITAKLQDMTVFTIVDFKKGYWMVVLHPEKIQLHSPRYLSMATAGQNMVFHQIQRRLRHSIIWNSHCTRKLRSFIGMINYLNMYSALSAHLAASLSTLTHQAVDYKPGNVHFENFNRLKVEISNMKALPYFDVNAETTLQVNTSKKGLGACLIQKGKVICYASRAITKTEQNYQNLEREALGTIWGMKKERNSHWKQTRNHL